MLERKDRRLTGVMRLAYGVAVKTNGVMRLKEKHRLFGLMPGAHSCA